MHVKSIANICPLKYKYMYVVKFIYQFIHNRSDWLTGQDTIQNDQFSTPNTLLSCTSACVYVCTCMSIRTYVHVCMCMCNQYVKKHPLEQLLSLADQQTNSYPYLYMYMYVHYSSLNLIWNWLPGNWTLFTTWKLNIIYYMYTCTCIYLRYMYYCHFSKELVKPSYTCTCTVHIIYKV